MHHRASERAGVIRRHHLHHRRRCRRRLRNGGHYHLLLGVLWTHYAFKQRSRPPLREEGGPPLKSGCGTAIFKLVEKWERRFSRTRTLVAIAGSPWD